MSGGATHLAARTGMFGLLSRDLMSALWPDKRLSTKDLTALIGPAMLRSRGVTNYLKQRGMLNSVCTAQGWCWFLEDLGMVAAALLSPMRTSTSAEAHKARVVPDPPGVELLAALPAGATELDAVLGIGEHRKRRTKAQIEAANNPRPEPYMGEVVPPRRFDTFSARLPTDPGPPLPRAGSMDALRLPSVIGGRLLSQHYPEQLARGGRGLA